MENKKCNCKAEVISNLMRNLNPYQQSNFITTLMEIGNYNPILNFRFSFNDINININKLKEDLIKQNWWNNDYNLINDSITYDNGYKIHNFSLVYKVEDNNYNFVDMLILANNIVLYFKTVK